MSKQTSINYGQIIIRSFAITLKNKWLWIYGLLLAGGSYTGSNANFTNLNRSFVQNKPTPAILPSQSTMAFGLILASIKEWLSGIPPQTWILFVLVLLTVVLFAVFVGFVINAWARAALIGGLQAGQGNQPVNLLTSSTLGIKNLKSMILYQALADLLFLLALVAFSFIFGLAFVVFSLLPLKALWFTLEAIIAFPTLVLLLAILAMVNVYAHRLIIFKGFRPWAAWKKGLSLGQGHFLSTLVMAIINLAFGCLGSIVILSVSALIALPSLFVTLPSILFGFASHSPSLIGTGVFFATLTVILISIAISLLRAVIVVFTNANWNLFFDEIVKGEDHD